MRSVRGGRAAYADDGPLDCSRRSLADLVNDDRGRGRDHDRVAPDGNRVFGINVNGSSMTFSQATVSVTGNALGIQIATSGNAFINDRNTVLNVNNNLSTGLTVVSGAHMVSFGGTINASGILSTVCR